MQPLKLPLFMCISLLSTLAQYFHYTEINGFCYFGIYKIEFQGIRS